VISVYINDNIRQFDNPISITELLENMLMARRRIAVERNGEIVPRSQFDQLMLEDGDRLEIVIAVGGG